MKLDIQKELFRGLYLDCLHTNPKDSTRPPLMAQASTLVPLQSIIVPELAKSSDSARLLTRACIYLKINKLKL